MVDGGPRPDGGRPWIIVSEPDSSEAPGKDELQDLLDRGAEAIGFTSLCSWLSKIHTTIMMPNTAPPAATASPARYRHLLKSQKQRPARTIATRAPSPRAEEPAAPQHIAAPPAIDQVLPIAGRLEVELPLSPSANVPSQGAAPASSAAPCLSTVEAKGEEEGLAEGDDGEEEGGGSAGGQSARLWEPLPNIAIRSGRLHSRTAQGQEVEKEYDDDDASTPSQPHQSGAHCNTHLVLSQSKDARRAAQYPSGLCIGSKPQAPYRDAFRRHPKRQLSSQSVGARDTSTWVHTHVINTPLQRAEALAARENDGVGLTTTAPVMRKRAWEIGEMPHPTKWEPPVVIKAPELASAIGIDWAKYHERLGLRKPLPTGEGTPGEDTGRGTPDEGGPPSATLSIAVTSKMSQNGHTLGMNLSSSGTRTTWTEINEDGHCPTGHWIYEVKVGQWSTDESSEQLPTRAPLSNSTAGKAPTSQAEKPKAAEKTFVITRDGRRLDVGMRTATDVELLARVQGHATLKPPSTAHPSIAMYIGSDLLAGESGSMQIAPPSPMPTIVVPRLGRMPDASSLTESPALVETFRAADEYKRMHIDYTRTPRSSARVRTSNAESGWCENFSCGRPSSSRPSTTRTSTSSARGPLRGVSLAAASSAATAASSTTTTSAAGLTMKAPTRRVLPQPSIFGAVSSDQTPAARPARGISPPHMPPPSAAQPTRRSPVAAGAPSASQRGPSLKV
jgi:hypothetical protein